MPRDDKKDPTDLALRIRELEVWRVEHEKWDRENHEKVADDFERYEGVEVRVRLLELWKEQQAALTPQREQIVHSVKLDLDAIRDTFQGDIKSIDNRVRHLQFRLMLVWGAAIAVAQIVAYVLGGLALRRLLGISSVPPPLQ